ncbi:hypothetical protein Q8F55_007265 [Vanrija albida]|uniref:Uncharacterized protein n=1 Tax=Vanrija albida TaxID=181172 RepID=A0ABR3PZ99_9TREE
MAPPPPVPGLTCYTYDLQPSAARCCVGAGFAYRSQGVAEFNRTDANATSINEFLTHTVDSSTIGVCSFSSGGNTFLDCLVRDLGIVSNPGSLPLGKMQCRDTLLPASDPPQQALAANAKVASDAAPARARWAALGLAAVLASTLVAL